MHDAAVNETFFLTEPEPYSLAWTMEVLRDTLKPSKHKHMAAPIWAAKMLAVSTTCCNSLFADR